MQTESPETSLLSIIALISFFIFLIIQIFSDKILDGVLLDDDFNKPQAFHSQLISRSGGLASIISFTFFMLLSLLNFFA